MLSLESLDVVFVLDLLFMYVVSQSFHTLLKELDLCIVLRMKLLGFGALLWLGCLGRPRGFRDHYWSHSSPSSRPFCHLPVMITNLSLSSCLLPALLLASTFSCSPPLLGCFLGCSFLFGLFRSLCRLFLLLHPIPEVFAFSVSGAFHFCQIIDLIFEHGVSLS